MMNFAELTPPDYVKYRPYFKDQCYELCAYSLSSAISWKNDRYHSLAAEYNNMLLIAAEFYVGSSNRYLLLPVSFGKKTPPHELVTIAELSGYTEFSFVPESYVTHFGEDEILRHFKIMPQGAYDDYVYRVTDLAELKGNRYSKKRNLIHQFVRDYVDLGRVSIEPISAANTDACLEFLEEWCIERSCDAEDQVDLACEKQAAANTLTHYDAFDLTGILLRIDGKVSAFGISAPLTPDMATLQYEKAIESIKGLYQYFDNACARMLFSGYTWLNKESDMGIPGLEKAKRSYHPERMIRSMRLVLKG
ncbi:phosphatidylglycerol lysyltransferase domain-containing protein [Desulfosarcina sp. OttesenSCG-928-A07]|nr:phosphatidylglycerol lysyltransferase domain-containing protein [Desulfosarcina sp. OttesenSCG-928-A07]